MTPDSKWYSTKKFLPPENKEVLVRFLYIFCLKEERASCIDNYNFMQFNKISMATVLNMEEGIFSSLGIGCVDGRELIENLQSDNTCWCIWQAVGCSDLEHLPKSTYGEPPIGYEDDNILIKVTHWAHIEDDKYFDSEN